MTVTLEEMIAEESQESRERIFELVREMREEMRLRELRRFRRLTQTRLSKKLKIGQEGISRMEKRADMYISTLRGYVEGVGGKLSLVVEFPDTPPVILAGLGLDEEKAKRKRQKKAAVLPEVKTKGNLKLRAKQKLKSGGESRRKVDSKAVQSA